MMGMVANLLSEYKKRRAERRSSFERSTSFGDYFTDRWERASFEGFGEGSSCYDNVLVIGSVKVGNHTWIGPNVVLDGSGGLQIGDYCAISAGSQIYTHDAHERCNKLGKAEIERKPTRIGNGVFVGPNCIVQMGVTVGDKAMLFAGAVLTRDVPEGARVGGVPARTISPKMRASDDDSECMLENPPGGP